MQQKGLSATTLKIIAAVATVCYTLSFFSGKGTLYYTVMQTIGFIAIPIFSFLLAESYFYTENTKAFIGRLAIFTLISHLVYVMFHLYNTAGKEDNISYIINTTNMTSLLGGFIALWVFEELKSPILKSLFATLLIAVTFTSPSFVCSAALVFLLGIFNEETKKSIVSIVSVSLLIIAFTLFRIDNVTKSDFISIIPYLGMLLSIPFVLSYNGTRGAEGSPKLSKWFFYIFYPAQFAAVLLVGFVYFKFLT